jgi:hypothetical protein
MAILKHGTSDTVMQRLCFPNRSARVVRLGAVVQGRLVSDCFLDLPGSSPRNRRGQSLGALRRLHRRACRVTGSRGFADRHHYAGENRGEQNDLDVRCAIKEIE